MPPDPNGLQHLDYFVGRLAGSRLSTGARLELIAVISGSATAYGAVQAAPAACQMVSAAEQVQALYRAAVRARYPNLTAALAAGRPPYSHAGIFGSCIERLIDPARPG